jgi:hypothetical protein
MVKLQLLEVFVRAVSRLGIVIVTSLGLSACVAVPTKSTTTSASEATTAGTRKVVAPTREELENQRRSDLSKNDKLVEFRPQCEGLFIPEVKRTMFQGLIPMYSIFVLNNSKNRYSVKYDVTFLERTQNVLVNSAEQFTEEKSFVVRPGTYTKFEIAEQNHSGGRKIAAVRKIVVLRCDKT